MRSQSPLRFDPEVLDKGLLGRHPLSGLHFDTADTIGSDLANAGAIFHYESQFFSWEGPLTKTSAAGWSLGDASGGAPTIVVSTAPRGEIIITADATAGAKPVLMFAPALTGHTPFLYQKKVSNPPNPFVPAKRLWMFAKVKLSTAAGMSVFMGFGTPATDPSTTANLPTAGIFLRKDVTDLDFTLHARHAGVSTAKTLATGVTLADATYVTVGFAVDVDGNINPYNGTTLKGTKSISGTDANLPLSTDGLVPMIAFLTASKTLTLDFLAFGMEL